MSTDAELCAGATYHAPLVLWTQRHHVFPKYLCAMLGLPVIPDLVPLCCNCHERVHHALTHLINTGTNPHRLSSSELGYVNRAWDWWIAGLI